MKHLVLGSSGQVGSHLTKFLQQNNEVVIPYDIADNPIEDLRLYDNKPLIDKIKSADFIHFLAFDVGGAKYLEKHQSTYEFIKNNIQIMDRTFDLIYSYKKPFIFTSSQMSTMNHSTYGILKTIGERYTESIGGLNIKFWNIYGKEPNPNHIKNHVITDFIHMAKSGVINMLTDGNEKRQFLYADDASECLYALVKNYNSIDKKKNFHISSFKWISIYDIALEIQKLSKCKIHRGDRQDSTHMGITNDPDPYILNMWKPKTTITEGIQLLYE